MPGKVSDPHEFFLFIDRNCKKEAKKEASECKEDFVTSIAKITAIGCIFTNFIFGISIFFKLFLNYDLKTNILVLGIVEASWLGSSLLGYCYVVIKNKIKGKKT